MNRRVQSTALIVVAMLALFWLIWRFWFVQDDAFISYRYVANFLNGDGLVFNVGERVEGFTNFGWVVFLLLFGALGLNVIVVSQVIGLLCAAGMVVVTAAIARDSVGRDQAAAATAAVLLVAANLSLAYWAAAGLETAAFALAVSLSLWWYLRCSRLLIWGLVLAVWLRPEGALVAFLLLLVAAAVDRRKLAFVFWSGVVAFVLSLPMVFFKIAYYGSLLPNPFYAKTGWNADQLMAGIDYALRFFGHYPAFAAAMLVPIPLFRRLNRSARALWLFGALYVLYIAVVGGDVLKVHRFFVPVLPVFGVLAVLMILELPVRLKPGWRTGGTVAIVLALSTGSILIPKGYIENYHDREVALIDKMQFLAEKLSETDDRPFTAALTTIGVFSYELVGHRVIDMLGLTDATIARTPSEPTPGIESTWRERQYNSAYVLGEEPDYIVFSTGPKPSAPAEIDLLQYPAFVENYRTRGWFYATDSTGTRGVSQDVYKRVHDRQGGLEPEYPLEVAQRFKAAYEYSNRRDYNRVLATIEPAILSSPEPVFPYVLYLKALSLRSLSRHEEARALLNRIVAQDSAVVEAHRDLYMYATISGQPEKAAIHRDWLKRTIPWYLPILQRSLDQMMDSRRNDGVGE